MGGIVFVAVACGGTSTDLIGDGGASGDGSANGDGGSSNGDGGGTRDGGARGDGGSCPDVGGSYSISHSGDGCGDLSADATECVQQDNTCRAQIKPSGGGGGLGVEATVTIGADGSFEGANVKLGSTDRSGCTGTWDDSTSTLTIDCGGTGTSQSCVVTLTRTSTATCN